MQVKVYIKVASLSTKGHSYHVIRNRSNISKDNLPQFINSVKTMVNNFLYRILQKKIGTKVET